MPIPGAALSWYAVGQVPTWEELEAWDDEDLDAVAGAEPPAGTTGRGAWVTRRFFALCENPRTRERMLDTVRSSATNAVAGRLLVGTVGQLLLWSMRRSRRTDAALTRCELVAAQLAGIAVIRYVTQVEPVASMPVDDLVALVSPAVSATLTT